MFVEKYFYKGLLNKRWEKKENQTLLPSTLKPLKYIRVGKGNLDEEQKFSK